MNRFPSVKENRDFKLVYNKGKSFANKYLVMYVLEKESGESSRIGISVSKKVGNSVIRHNRCRIIREIFRLNNEKLKGIYDIIVVVRNNAKDISYADMESAYMHLLRLHGIMVL